MELTKIYGIHALEEAITANMTIAKIYVQQDNQNNKIQKLLQHCSSLGATVSYTPIEKLNKLSKGGNHQGIVATISPIEFLSLEELIGNALTTSTTPVFLLLDQISDVRNFGAIIRSASAANVSGIIIQKKGGAPINADTVKTSAGTIFNMPICKVDHIKDAIFHLQAENIPTIAATEKTETTVYQADLTKAFALVLGSEGRGINPSVLKMCDQHVSIPIAKQVDSLNVSVACAVILFEAVRQRI